MPTTVLVVDDSRTKRYLLASWLTRAGYTVIEAENGADALARVEVDRIDLLTHGSSSGLASALIWDTAPSSGTRTLPLHPQPFVLRPYDVW